jgi:hypothetical protein
MHTVTVHCLVVKGLIKIKSLHLRGGLYCVSDCSINEMLLRQGPRGLSHRFPRGLHPTLTVAHVPQSGLAPGQRERTRTDHSGRPTEPGDGAAQDASLLLEIRLQLATPVLCVIIIVPDSLFCNKNDLQSLLVLEKSSS